MTEIRFERIQSDGVVLNVARAGSGPPVILLHGFPENWRSWKHQIAALVEVGFSVWAPNLRGYEGSGIPQDQSACSIEHLCSDVAAVVRATGSDQAHIVGHDWGG